MSVDRLPKEPIEILGVYAHVRAADGRTGKAPVTIQELRALLSGTPQPDGFKATPPADDEDTVKLLRAALLSIVPHLGNASRVSEECSDEFVAEIAKETILVLERLGTAFNALDHAVRDAETHSFSAGACLNLLTRAARARETLRGWKAPQ